MRRLLLMLAHWCLTVARIKMIIYRKKFEQVGPDDATYTAKFRSLKTLKAYYNRIPAIETNFGGEISHLNSWLKTVKYTFKAEPKTLTITATVRPEYTLSLYNSICYVTDDSHGWLKVPKHLVQELRLKSHISTFSYVSATHVYLEEDCDAALMLPWLRAHGIGWDDIPCRRDPNRSPIRNLAPFKGHL